VVCGCEGGALVSHAGWFRVVVKEEGMKGGGAATGYPRTGDGLLTDSTRTGNGLAAR